MNNWGTHREVEKVKAPTQLQRHQALREEAIRVNAELGEVDKALALISTPDSSGHPCPARRKLLAAADLINRLAGELR